MLRVAFDSIVGSDSTGDLVNLDLIKDKIQSSMSTQLAFLDLEFTAAFEQLEAENICMIVDDQITLI